MHACAGIRLGPHLYSRLSESMHVPVEKLCPGSSLLPMRFSPGGGDGEMPGGLGDVPGLGEGLASGGGGLGRGGGLVLVLGPCFGKT